jgi:ribosomal protein S18 acetylase RimI-like enzyme
MIGGWYTRPHIGAGMRVTSLGCRTDLIFPKFDGILIDRGDYLAVRSPLNPTFYWGNFLLFTRPPKPGDLEVWRELFSREIGSRPETKHMAFTWDSPEGEEGFVQPFVEAGFNLERNVVQVGTALKLPARASKDLVVRPLRTESEFAQVLEQQVLSRDDGHEEAAYRTFRIFMMQRYRRMEQAGLGHWYGGFLKDQLVADLGVFHDGHGLARYQSVETHPDFRRQGICGRLVYEAGRQAIAEYALQSLVIIAEADTSASRIYASAGFKPMEKNVGLLWWERTPQSP